MTHKTLVYSASALIMALQICISPQLSAMDASQSTTKSTAKKQPKAVISQSAVYNMDGTVSDAFKKDFKSGANGTTPEHMQWGVSGYLANGKKKVFNHVKAGSSGEGHVDGQATMNEKAFKALLKKKAEKAQTGATSDASAKKADDKKKAEKDDKKS